MKAPLIAIGIALAAIAALLWGAYEIGHSAGEDHIQAQWNAERAATSDAITELVKRHNEQERKWADELHDTQARLHAAQRQNLQEVDTTLADLRGGNLRLRERFQGCQRQLSEATTAGTGDDGARRGGLSAADQEFLIRIAGEADSVVNRLTACQEHARKVSR
jgi:gas vesicle protein